LIVFDTDVHFSIVISCFRGEIEISAKAKLYEKINKKIIHRILFMYGD
jgi:hypothetical protein